MWMVVAPTHTRTKPSSLCVPFHQRLDRRAAARLARPCVAVSRSAQGGGCSRQAVCVCARTVKAAVEAGCGGGETREALIEQRESLVEGTNQLWEWVGRSIKFAPARQQEFVAPVV
jgi:hypothetical protein